MTNIDKVIKICMEDLVEKDVLEIGCGSGVLSLELLKISKSVICLDIEDVRINEEVKERVKFFVMVASNTTFEDNSFDTIIAYNAAGHFGDKMENIILECSRIIKETGKIIFISSWSLDKYAITNDIPSIAKKNNFDVKMKI